MILSAKNINGLIVGIDIDTWDSIGEPFKYETSLSEGYEDISAIVNWDKFKVVDYSRTRDEILPLFYAEAGSQLQNFASLSTEKKLIACKYFLIPYSIRIQIITEAQDAENWIHLLSESKKSRSECIEAMRLYVGSLIRTGSLSIEQTQAFFKDVSEFIYLFEEANISDFKNYIFGLMPYEGVFTSKSYWTQEIQDKLVNIYNGDY